MKRIIRIPKSKRYNHIKLRVKNGRIQQVIVKSKRIMKEDNNMDKVVRTSTLFRTKKDISRMTTEERMQYIDTLSDEFMDSADALMKSLANK